jgi:hypothetical protein
MSLRRLRGSALSFTAVAWLALAGCDDDKCKDEEKIAIELTIHNPDRLDIDVTAELDGNEQSCDFIDPSLIVGAQGSSPIYTCLEQGGGTYKVRVYVRDDVIYEEDDEVEADACHIKQLVRAEIDLTGKGPAPSAGADAGS